MKTGRLKKAENLLAKAHTKDSTKALSKLTTVVDGRRRIISDPPMIVPIEEVFSDVQASALYERDPHGARARIGAPCSPTAGTCWSSSRWSTSARKVVGVGSVGTRAWILLMDSAGRRWSRCSCRPRRPSRPF